MKRIILIPLSVAALFIAGCACPCAKRTATACECSPPAKSTSTAFEGVWKGREVTPGHEGAASLTFSGHTLDFHGADADDWVKGTFTLREDAAPKQLTGTITGCASSDSIGSKVYAIYKIEEGTMTLTGGRLDNTDFPSSFDAPGFRQFIFKHDSSKATAP